MTIFIMLVFSLSLIYLVIAERFKTFALIIGLQGLLLFGISYFELEKVNTINLLFIFAETILFKTIIVPLLLMRIIEKNRLNRIHHKSMPGYFSILLSMSLLTISFLIANFIENIAIERVYFTVSLFALFTGMMLVITRRKILSHLVGFLVIENAVFMFSLAIGNEMPMLINTGILLDIFISVLILGSFATKVGETIHSLDKEELSMLRD